MHHHEAGDDEEQIDAGAANRKVRERVAKSKLLLKNVLEVGRHHRRRRNRPEYLYRCELHATTLVR